MEMPPNSNQSLPSYLRNAYGFDYMSEYESQSYDETTELPEIPGGVTLDDVSPILSNTFIDTPDAIAKLVDEIYLLPDDSPHLFMDIRGSMEHPRRPISILQIHNPTFGTFLVDVYLLRMRAFDTPGKLNPSATLHSIITSSSIPKVFFDFRNAAHDFHNCFGIQPKNVHDIQVIEVFTRNNDNNNHNSHMPGQWQCINRDIEQSERSRNARRNIRCRGQQHFLRIHGGGRTVFLARPLNMDVQRCIVQDVELLPVMYTFYSQRVTSESSQNSINAEIMRRLTAPRFIEANSNRRERQ